MIHKYSKKEQIPEDTQKLTLSQQVELALQHDELHEETTDEFFNNFIL